MRTALGVALLLAFWFVVPRLARLAASWPLRGERQREQEHVTVRLEWRE